MRKLCRFTSSCAYARSEPSLFSSMIHSVVSNDSGSVKRRPRSVCTDAQDDLGLCYQICRRHVFAWLGPYSLLMTPTGRVNRPKKVRVKSRECHNHKPQPLPDTKKKREQTKPNKRTKCTNISSLFPKRGNRNVKRTEKKKKKQTNKTRTK